MSHRADIPIPGKQISEAETELRAAIAAAPQGYRAYLDLAALLARLDRASEMFPLLDAVLAAQPRTPWALSLKAEILVNEQRVEEALAVHRQLLEYAPNAAIPWMNYGFALKTVGQTDEAVAAYRQSLRLDPNNGFAWWGLANLRTVQFSAADADAIERAVSNAANDHNRVQLYFALGKALGDLDRFEQSFRCYEAANILRGTLAPCDPDAVSNMVSETEKLFTQDFFSRRIPDDFGDPDVNIPTFIVGMPRSGSTLVEQILSNHPMIEGMGELFALPNALARVIGGDVSGAKLPQRINRLNSDELAEIGGFYMAAVNRKRRSRLPYFTDKLPSNWQLTGLIPLLFPKAKIIDARRQPLACCTSCFFTYFNLNTKVPTSLKALGRQYSDYVRMMAHMDSVLPGRVSHVQHEALVEDAEGTTRALCDELDIPFDAACLDFDQNPRPVYTPSAQQVRAPINRNGIEYWKNYEPWLEELKTGLND